MWVLLSSPFQLPCQASKRDSTYLPSYSNNNNNNNKIVPLQPEKHSLETLWRVGEALHEDWLQWLVVRFNDYRSAIQVRLSSPFQIRLRRSSSFSICAYIVISFCSRLSRIRRLSKVPKLQVARVRRAVRYASTDSLGSWFGVLKQYLLYISSVSPMQYFSNFWSTMSMSRSWSSVSKSTPS